MSPPCLFDAFPSVPSPFSASLADNVPTCQDPSSKSSSPKELPGGPAEVLSECKKSVKEEVTGQLSCESVDPALLGVGIYALGLPGTVCASAAMLPGPRDNLVEGEA